MSTSLTMLSRKKLVKEGYDVVEKVEHFNSYTRRMNDLLGVGDLLALNGKELLLIQVTSRGHLSTRRKKALASDKLPLWLSAGGKFRLEGWQKYGYRWRVKIIDLDNNVIEDEKTKK